MTQPRHETYTLMKARARKRSDSCRAESIRDTSTLPTPMTTRSVVRQVCIGDMEEELHRAFAMARYIYTRVTRKFTRYKPHDKSTKNSFVSKLETSIPVLNIIAVLSWMLPLRQGTRGDRLRLRARSRRVRKTRRVLQLEPGRETADFFYAYIIDTPKK